MKKLFTTTLMMLLNIICWSQDYQEILNGNFLDNSVTMQDAGYSYKSMEKVNNNEIHVAYEQGKDDDIGRLTCYIVYRLDETVKKMHFEFKSKELYLTFYNECTAKMIKEGMWGYDYFFKYNGYGFGLVSFHLDDETVSYQVDIFKY